MSDDGLESTFSLRTTRVGHYRLEQATDQGGLGCRGRVLGVGCNFGRYEMCGLSSILMYESCKALEWAVGSKIEGGVLWPVRDGVGVGDGVGVWVDAWMEGGRLA